MKVHLLFDLNEKRFIITTPKDLGGSSLITIFELTLGFYSIGSNQYILETGSLSSSERFNVIRNVIDLFVSEKLKNKVKSAEILPEVLGSDHCPVFVEI